MCFSSSKAYHSGNDAGIQSNENVRSIREDINNAPSSSSSDIQRRQRALRMANNSAYSSPFKTPLGA